jgi:hypothetical protein
MSPQLGDIIALTGAILWWMPYALIGVWCRRSVLPELLVLPGALLALCVFLNHYTWSHAGSIVSCLIHAYLYVDRVALVRELSLASDKGVAREPTTVDRIEESAAVSIAYAVTLSAIAFVWFWHVMADPKGLFQGWRVAVVGAGAIWLAAVFAIPCRFVADRVRRKAR